MRGGGELNMVKINQDHFQAILSIFVFFWGMLSLGGGGGPKKKRGN